MPTWVTPPDFTVGQVHTAAHHDDIATDLNVLYNASHELGGSVVPAVLWSTASTSMVDWNGGTPMAVTFTKRGGTETQLRVDITGSGYITGGAASLIQMGLLVGGTDYSNALPHYWVAPDHQEMAETIYVAGLAAGSWTPKLRVKVATGGFTFNSDGNDFVQMIVSERYVA